MVRIPITGIVADYEYVAEVETLQEPSTFVRKDIGRAVSAERFPSILIFWPENPVFEDFQMIARFAVIVMQATETS